LAFHYRESNLKKPHKINLKASLENLYKIRCFIEQSGNDLGMGPRALAEFKIVVDEAVTNIILHSDGGKGNELEITIAPLDDAIEIIIRDQAAPFNSSAVVEPMLNSPLGDRPYGGMGLYLIRKLTDNAEYSYIPDQGNELRLLKLGVIS
jgi:serine/threonine-protein kinase RsbW